MLEKVATTIMKYAIVIPDGCADEPQAALGGKTPLQAAHTPNMDRIAIEGRQGTARTVPEGFESGSDVATMCLLGYDPNVYHTGRAPLETVAPLRMSRGNPSLAQSCVTAQPARCEPEECEIR